MSKKVLKKILNADQENFCKYFTTPDIELYGNGTLSYLEAYSNKKGSVGKNATKPMSYSVAGANAYKLLKKPEIIDRVNSLLEAKGFNDQNVDKQHLFMINQHADLKTKLGAVAEYNKLKKRIDSSQKTLIVTGNSINFEKFNATDS